MREPRIHWQRDDGAIACNVGKRWTSQVITSTRGRDRVTCLTCRRRIAETEKAEQHARLEANRAAQTTLLDPTVGRSNVVRLDDHRKRC